MRFAAAGVLLLAVAACTRGTYVLPERTDAVRAEEAALGNVITESKALSPYPGTCRVRLLGEQETARFVWADCDFGEGGATSVPLRVDGDRVTAPADGAGYAPSVRKMFPRELADRVLEHDDELRP